MNPLKIMSRALSSSSEKGGVSMWDLLFGFAIIWPFVDCLSVVKLPHFQRSRSVFVCASLSVAFEAFQMLRLAVWSVSMPVDYDKLAMIIIITPRNIPEWINANIGWTHLNNSFGSFFDFIVFGFRMPVSESESSSVIILPPDAFALCTGFDFKSTVWSLIARFAPLDWCSMLNVAFDGSAATGFFVMI